MKIPLHDLDKKELLGFRLLTQGKSRADRLIGGHIIGAKVGRNGKGPPVQ